MDPMVSVYGISSDGVEIDLKSIRLVKEDGSNLVDDVARAQNLQQVQAEINRAVESWARKNLSTVAIPLERIDMVELLSWIQRQTSYPRDQEVLVESELVEWGYRTARRLVFDAGQTRPTTGTMHMDIRGRVVQIDSVALDATQAGTYGQDLTDSPGTYLTVTGAISSDEDGSFDVALYVAKDLENDNALLVQIGGNTNLERDVTLTATEDIPFLTHGEISNHVLTLHKRTGANKTTEAAQLPTPTPITPDTTNLEPPDVVWDHAVGDSVMTWQADSGSKVVPLEGEFQVIIGTETYRNDGFTYQALRAKTRATTGQSVGTLDVAYGIKVPGTTTRIGIGDDDHVRVFSRADARVIVESHYRLTVEAPTVYYQKTFAVSAGNRNRWQRDEDSKPYDSSGGMLDYIFHGSDKGDFDPDEFSRLPTVVEGAVRAGNQGIEITGKGAIAKFSDNHFAFAPSNDSAALPDGTELTFELKGNPSSTCEPTR